MNYPNPVITGIGVVAPTGIGLADHWAASLAGECRLGPVTTFDASALPVQVVGEVTGFDGDVFVPSRLRVQTDRWTWMGLAATQLALADASLTPAEHEPYDLSVITASGSGGNVFGQREIHALWAEGPAAVSAYQSIGWFYAASSGQISIKEQLKGGCGVMVSDAAGALDAVAAATRLIRRGTKAAVVGGTEAPLSPYALACQCSQPTVSAERDPMRAYRPFTPDATGYVPGEGGAMLVLEHPDFAADRSAGPAYAEVAGTAATHDAHYPSDPPSDHRQLARAMRLAIARAGITADQVDVIFADGAGDVIGDRYEAAAIREVFDTRHVPVTVPKTMTGRLCSGGAALDLAWAAMALAEGIVPPTVNVHPRDQEYGLDIVTRARTIVGLDTALVVARGAGGFNSTAVLHRRG